MSRRANKPLPVELFRKVEGPEILKKLGEARQTLCQSRIPYGTPDKLVANDIISRIDDMAEMITGDRTHFHIKMHS
ncbi:hypothetical protein [Microvirga lenta]|uniref:hypothetical protein n=1 Tax=Microvirga lenta TaxID=2881337 RepID=UPI001CFE14AC|nr:hypothetical protein [Microvirga lenta]MCB5173626.1 hypothetical protein [Microvirga lenta]